VRALVCADMGVSSSLDGMAAALNQDRTFREQGFSTHPFYAGRRTRQAWVAEVRPIVKSDLSKIRRADEE